MNDRQPGWTLSDVRMSLNLAGTDVDISCTVLAIRGGRVHLRTSQQVLAGFRVVVKLDHISLPGEVGYCAPKDQGYLICVELDRETAHQRGEPRFPVNLPAKVIVLDGSATLIFPGTVADVSRSGIGLLVPAALEIASLICVETATMLIAGEVRYCLKKGDKEFRVGLETTDVFSDPDADPNVGDHPLRWLQRVWRMP